MVDHSTLNRWVLKYAPELDKRIRPQLSPINDSWRVDETVHLGQGSMEVVVSCGGLKGQYLGLHAECQGFASFKSARRTLRGMEAMNMIRFGQVQGVDKGDVRAQVELVSQLFGVAR